MMAAQWRGRWGLTASDRPTTACTGARFAVQRVAVDVKRLQSKFSRHTLVMFPEGFNKIHLAGDVRNAGTFNVCGDNAGKLQISWRINL